MESVSTVAALQSCGVLTDEWHIPKILVALCLHRAGWMARQFHDWLQLNARNGISRFTLNDEMATTDRTTYAFQIRKSRRFHHDKKHIQRGVGIMTWIPLHGNDPLPVYPWKYQTNLCAEQKSNCSQWFNINTNNFTRCKCKEATEWLVAKPPKFSPARNAPPFSCVPIAETFGC